MVEPTPKTEFQWPLRFGWSTAFILLVIALVFAVESSIGALENDAVLLRMGALPNNGLHGQYWRLLSFGLLHWNVLHIVENAFCLLCLGLIVERRVGAGRLLALFAVATVASGFAILLKYQFVTPVGSSVGASGGIFGIMGAALVVTVRVPPTSSLIRFGLWLFPLVGLAVSLLPGVSLAGHVAGLLIGVPFGVFTRIRLAS
jgi:rhomboid protease GluP